MAKSSLITVTNYRGRPARVIKEFVDALDTGSSGHNHDGTDSQVLGTAIGSAASGGDLTLQSTTHATKGAVTIANAEQGLKIGGVPDRGTTEGTNQLVLVNGTAPVGTLTNAITFYSASGEANVIDAAGNVTLLSPHSEDGDYIIHSYSAKKDKTVVIHLEKLIGRLAEGGDEVSFADLIEEMDGQVPHIAPEDDHEPSPPARHRHYYDENNVCKTPGCERVKGS